MVREYGQRQDNQAGIRFRMAPFLWGSLCALAMVDGLGDMFFLAYLAGLPYRIPVAYCLMFAKENPRFLWYLAGNGRSYASPKKARG